MHRRRRGRPALTRFANSFIHQNVGEDVCVHLAQGGSSTAGWRPPPPPAPTDGRAGAPGRQHPGRRRVCGPSTRTGRAWPRPPGRRRSTTTTRPPTRPRPTTAGRRVGAFVDAGPGLRAAGYCDTDGLAPAPSPTRPASGPTGAEQPGDARRASTRRDDSRRLWPRQARAGSPTSTAPRRGDGGRRGPGGRRPRRHRAGRLRGRARTRVRGHHAGLPRRLRLQRQGGTSRASPASSSATPSSTRPSPSGTTPPTPAPSACAFDADGTPKRRVDLVTDGRSHGPGPRPPDRGPEPGTDEHRPRLPGGDAWGPFPSNLFIGAGRPSRRRT